MDAAPTSLNALAKGRMPEEPEGRVQTIAGELLHLLKSEEILQSDYTNPHMSQGLT